MLPGLPQRNVTLLGLNTFGIQFVTWCFSKSCGLVGFQGFPCFTVSWLLARYSTVLISRAVLASPRRDPHRQCSFVIIDSARAQHFSPAASSGGAVWAYQPPILVSLGSRILPSA